MGFRTISVKEEQKEILDELKNEKRRETGEDPSYSDILDDLVEGTEPSKKKKRKEEKGRDFLELF